MIKLFGEIACVFSCTLLILIFIPREDMQILNRIEGLLLCTYLLIFGVWLQLKK